MEPFAQADLDTFRRIVARQFGLQFDNGKKELLADILRERREASGCATAALYLASISSSEREELRALAARLTVTETYFFRGADQFRALSKRAIPDRIADRRKEGPLRLLSAGCSSGEEAYSLAILLRERFPELPRQQTEILGIDLNPAMIAKAKEARYHPWSLRETPRELREKYFRVEGNDFILADSIRSMVSFAERNLATCEFTSLEPFDIILCRNVIMYLVPEAAQSVITRLTEALEPDGFLFLGYAETLRGLSHAFQLCHTHDTFYYQKREAGAQPAAGWAQPPAGFRQSRAGVPSALADMPGTAWVDAVQQASERIHTLSRDMAALPSNGHSLVQAQQQHRSSLELGVAFELLRQERFREALDVLEALPPEVSGDPDAQLLQAGLLTNCGDLKAAEAVCQRILRVDDLNAGAHYLTALCRERAGDPNGAMEHDRAAIYLDAAFAMPHLHLGRLAKRSADLTTARRELECACMLLLREDPSRLLLFGGGFNREALVAFSRAELRACGGWS